MNAKFYPQALNGKTQAQALESLAMRYFILAFFAKGKTKLYLKNEAQDLSALKEALTDLGANVYRSNSIYTITPPEMDDYCCTELNVKDSLPAFRLLLPALTAVFERLDFSGSGKLTRKDLTLGLNILKGVTIGSKTLPMPVSGKLQSGEFMIEPDVNSGFVCSLIMALPMLDGDSTVVFREKPKKQLSYLLNLTLKAMREFGVEVENIENGLSVKGKQEYLAPQHELKVEGDFTTAGYFLSANLIGANVVVDNLDQNTLQPDKAIYKYLEALENGQEIELKGKTDFVFLLTALSCAMPKKTVINGVKLKDKDKEKFTDFTLMLARLGGEVELDGEKLTVVGKQTLSGGIMLDSLGDARIAMSLIILTCRLDSPVTILSVESAMTEQASFLNEFIKLGGKCETL